MKILLIIGLIVGGLVLINVVFMIIDLWEGRE